MIEIFIQSVEPEMFDELLYNEFVEKRIGEVNNMAYQVDDRVIQISNAIFQGVPKDKIYPKLNKKEEMLFDSIKSEREEKEKEYNKLGKKLEWYAGLDD